MPLDSLGALFYMAPMSTPAPSRLPFMKMHGLGNDFVVLDRRDGHAMPGADVIRAMADRRRGVGYDQLAVIEGAADADARLTFWNSDGSQSAACGNATRCIAAHLMDETGRDDLALVTARGRLAAERHGGVVAVNMGAPSTDWQGVPLAREVDTLHLPIPGDPVATGMGNPHCTFFVEDAESVDLASFGAEHEHHPLFPERTNVQLAQVLDRARIRMRVWERGVGITEASGSSSCATAVAAARRGLTERRVTVLLDGGELEIDWRDDGVWMAGPTAHVFDGVWHG
ncbi:diaminopimelate epimerase [Oceanicola granulosus HTCC2516]|uniref:Diaminopimelate epimerase n=2 Tax=Oceanicola granulosus TaxID=252302 RepID=Q2CK90_OCEGH|nr:diaminopimelate epimerase [Oceanicola granulosus HTCC2516]